MTNFEKYKDQITDLRFGVTKENKPVHCADIKCCECIFYKTSKTCGELLWEWLKAEYVELKKIDLPKDLPVDAKIEVSKDGIDWERRHFAGFNNVFVEVWMAGRTSWTTQERWDFEYARLPKENEADDSKRN